MFEPEKGWDSCYIYITLCLCHRRGGGGGGEVLLYSWKSVFVPGKAQTQSHVFSQYFHGTLCLCPGKGVTLAIFMELRVSIQKKCDACYIYENSVVVPENMPW